MWDNLLHFLPMSLLFVMMPGPDLAFILKTSFGQGRGGPGRGLSAAMQQSRSECDAAVDRAEARHGGHRLRMAFLSSSFMAHMRRYFERPQFRLRLERCTGLLLISFGIKLILAER